MKGLIQKDFYVMRERIRPVNYALIAFAALAVLTYFRSVGAMYVSLFLPLILVGIPKTIMVYDTQCKWDKFAIALPATRKTIIASRYLFFTILAVVMSIISSPSMYIISHFGIAFIAVFASIILYFSARYADSSTLLIT